MKTRTVIEIGVSVAAFAAAGVVLYRGVVRPEALPLTPPQAQVSQVAEPASVFPYGQTLDFDRVLSMRKLQFGTIEYPTVDPAADVGRPADDLFSKPTSTPR